MALTMKVAPDQVVRLKCRLEAVRDDVQDFLINESRNLRGVPLADDEVSQDAARDFAKAADQAIEVTKQYVDELNRVIDSLGEAVRVYNLVEDVNTTAMQQLNRGF